MMLLNLILTVLVGLAMICGVYRVIAGPDHLDRVLALDYMGIVGIAITILVVLFIKEPMILDIALCLALVGFLTAYIFSRHLSEGK